MRKNDRKISQVRKSSQDLFLEAKRRFHYRPQEKKTEIQKHPDPVNSPECSSVTEVNKEQSNDFSWLDKMVCGFDWAAKEPKQQENKKVVQQKLQQKTQKPKLNHIIKPRVVLGERKLNKSNSCSKPVVKRSLQKSAEKYKGKLHKAVVTKKHQIVQQELKEPQVELCLEPEECPELFPPTKRSDTPKDENQPGFNQLIHKIHTEPEPQVKILKIQQPAVLPQEILQPIQVKNQQIPPPTQKSPQRLNVSQSQSTRTLGKIKKNIRHQQQNSERAKIMHHSLSLTAVQRNQRRLGALSLCQETIQQEEEQRSSVSMKLQEKFREIFSELDFSKLGYIDRRNCCSDNIHDDIRYLVGPILSKIRYQEKAFTSETFIEEGKRIISALQSHEVSKLLRCSITNRLFVLDTKRSQYERKTFRNHSLAAIERQSCSALLKNNELFECTNIYSGRKKNSIDNHVVPSSSLNEEWSKQGDEPLEKARTRNIIKPPRPVPPTINISNRQSLRASMDSSHFEKHTSKRKQQLNELLSPEHIMEKTQPFRSRQSRSPTQLEISELDPNFNIDADRPGQLSEEKYILEKEEYSRIDFLNQKLSKYIQQNHIRVTRSNSLSLEFDELRKHL